MVQYLWNHTPISAPVEFRSNADLWVVEKLDKSFDIEQGQAHRWEVSFGLIPKLAGQEAPRVMTAIMLKGSEQHQMVMPQMPEVLESGKGLPNLVQTGQVQVEIAGSAGDSDIRLEPVDGVSTYRVVNGTFFQFDNHDKIYCVATGDSLYYTTIGPTSGNRGFYPPLKEGVPVGTGVKFWSDVILKHRIDPNVIRGISYQDGMLASIGQITVWEDV